MALLLSPYKQNGAEWLHVKTHPNSWKDYICSQCWLIPLSKQRVHTRTKMPQTNHEGFFHHRRNSKFGCVEFGPWNWTMVFHSNSNDMHQKGSFQKVTSQNTMTHVYDWYPAYFSSRKFVFFQHCFCKIPQKWKTGCWFSWIILEVQVVFIIIICFWREDWGHKVNNSTVQAKRK